MQNISVIIFGLIANIYLSYHQVTLLTHPLTHLFTYLLTYLLTYTVHRFNPWDVNTFLFNISMKESINNKYATKCGYNMHTCNQFEQECVRTKYKNKLNILERYSLT